MNKQEMNKQIAKILGFEEVGDKIGQWRYPEKYRHLIRAMPVTSIPDFVEIFDYMIEIETKLKYGFIDGGDYEH